MRVGELAISAGMALVAVAFYSLATFTQQVNPVDPGPAFYPRLVSLLLFAFAAAQIVRSLRSPKPGRGEEGGGTKRWAGAAAKLSLGTLVLSILYVAAFDKISYFVSTPSFLLGLMLLGGVRKGTVLLGVPLCYTLATYYLFGQLLMVPIP